VSTYDDLRKFTVTYENEVVIHGNAVMLCNLRRLWVALTIGAFGLEGHVRGCFVYPACLPNSTHPARQKLLTQPLTIASIHHS
jgi:hypothetical protein